MAVYNNILAGAAGQSGGADAGYKINRSLRFNSGDSAYLSRTPSSAGNRKTWTWSGWIKKTADAGSPDDALFTAGTAGATQNRFIIKFSTGDQSLEIGQDDGGTFTLFRKTSQVFRDYSSWGHLVVAFDSTNSTADDRLKIYWNGSQITDFATNNAITQNLDTFVNNTGAHYICDDVGNYHGNLDTYLAEVNFVDGQQLAASDFGEYDSSNVWQPKQFAGTYGTPVNQTETWSSVIKAGGTSYSPSDSDTGFLSAYAATKAFDFATTSSVAYTNNNNVWIYFTPATALTVSSTIRFGARNTVEVKINGTDYSYTGGDTTGDQTIRSISFSGSLTTFAIRDDDNSGYSTGLSFLEIDGVLLVDNGVTVPDNSFHLDFSDNSSDAALGTDSSGNGTTLPGVDFDASNDHVESADHADYSLGTNDFTLEGYIYPRNFDNYKALVMKYAGAPSTSSWWWSLNSSGHILFYLYYGSSEMGIVTTGTGMTLNKWNHVACVRDGSTARVYINGVQVGTGSIGTNSVNDRYTGVRHCEDWQCV